MLFLNNDKTFVALPEDIYSIECNFLNNCTTIHFSKYNPETAKVFKIVKKNFSEITRTEESDLWTLKWKGTYSRFLIGHAPFEAGQRCSLLPKTIEVDCFKCFDEDGEFVGATNKLANIESSLHNIYVVDKETGLMFPVTTVKIHNN